MAVFLVFLLNAGFTPSQNVYLSVGSLSDRHRPRHWDTTLGIYSLFLENPSLFSWLSEFTRSLQATADVHIPDMRVQPNTLTSL